MWALVPRRLQVLIVVAGTIITFAAVQAAMAVFTGNEVNPLQTISAVALIVGSLASLVFAVAWRPLWRTLPWLARHTFPDLNGEWKGELISTWVDPSTGKGVPPIPTTIHIAQGLFSLSVKLQTGESKSYSLRCFLEAFHDAGRFRIWYTYSNSPMARFRHRSAPHNGVAWLECDMDKGRNEMFGVYYTDRKTTGDISVSRGAGET